MDAGICDSPPLVRSTGLLSWLVNVLALKASSLSIINHFIRAQAVFSPDPYCISILFMDWVAMCPFIGI